MSKVPNCKDTKIRSKDTPGPGYYEKQNLNNSLSVDHKKSLSGNVALNNSISGTNPNQKN